MEPVANHRSGPPMVFWRSTPKLSDGDVVHIGETPVRFRVNGRARRVSLRLDPSRREVVAIAPSARRLPDAFHFAEQRREWIARRIGELPGRQPFAPGLVIEVDGEAVRLEGLADRGRAKFIAPAAGQPARLLAGGDEDAYGRAVQRLLKKIALSRLEERTAFYARRLGAPMPDVAVMDARMRWGSCRQGLRGEPGRIRYNWRLILAPRHVLNYVAAHECAHLIEANHSPAYWAVVDQIFGDHRAARAWLRTHGVDLHAFGV